MSEPASEAEESTACLWVKLYHKSGLDVRFRLPMIAWGAASDQVDEALAAGWSKDPPGSEPTAPGEERQEIGWVCRRQKENDDGSLTPVIDLYADHDRMTFKTLTVYLNNQAELDAFQVASGLKLAESQVYVGQGSPERGASKLTDVFIVRAPRPFTVISKPNPRHDPNETDVKKKKPKRIFVRWDGQQTSPTPVATNGCQTQQAVAVDGRHVVIVTDYRAKLAANPPLAQVNSWFPAMAALSTETKKAVWNLVGPYAHQQGWLLTTDKAGFFEPLKDNDPIPF